MASHQGLNPLRLGEPRPFRAKHGQRIVLPDNRRARGFQIRCGNARFFGDAIEPKTDKARYDDEGKIERADHACSPAMRGGAFQAGSFLRSAPRSRAERARGLARNSSGCGIFGFLPMDANVAACLGAWLGAWREPWPKRPVRSVRNCLTIRSSS